MKLLKHTPYIWAVAIALVFSSTFSSCKEDEPIDNSSKTGTLKLEFDHVWGIDMAPFYMNQTYVHPMSKDTLTITMLKYYISNVVLHKTDGSTYTIPESYYLLDPSNNIISLEGIPAGDYNRVDFLIGVDSLRNFSGLQTGALNPSNGMFWSWSTGYIFVRVEGTSPQSATGLFMYHLGGYEAPYVASHKKALNFGNEILSINPDANPTVHLNVNAARFWHGPVKLSELNIIHNIGENAVSISKNFADGFLFDHIHR